MQADSKRRHRLSRHGPRRSSMPPTTTARRSPTARTISRAGASGAHACARPGREARPRLRRPAARNGSTISPAAGPRRRCSCSSTAATGSATRRRRSPSSPTARCRTASTSRSSATRWRRKHGSPRSSPRCHPALTFLAGHAGELGFDGKRLFVGGWSAGGHLTAAVAASPGLPRRAADQRHLRSRADRAELSQREAFARAPTEIARLEPAAPSVRRHAAAAARGRRRRAARAPPAIAGLSRRRPARAACRCSSRCFPASITSPSSTSWRARTARWSLSSMR